MRVAATVALIVSAFGASHVQASEVFSGLKPGDCKDGAIANATLRDSVLAVAKIPLTVPIATALVEGRLGTLAHAKEIECLGKVCKGSDDALRNLHHQLLGLSDATPLGPKGFTIAVDPLRAPSRSERAERFLNGDWSWLNASCSVTIAETEVPGTPDAPTPRPSDPPRAELVLGKTEDDAGKDFGKRGFASIGLSSDREADETAWDVDAFLGYSSPLLGLGSEWEFQPFASLQYHSQKKVDDLSFGGALMWYPGNSGHLIRLKGAWETDIAFRSSVWRADLGWTPPLLDVCEESSVPAKVYANCEISLVADVQDIADAGRKEDLLDLESFARLGLDARFTYGRSVGEKFGFVIASAGFSFRQNPSSARGDAELLTASLGLSPSDQGAWKVSLDYTRGRDLTDLTKQDKIVITVGFRH